MTTTKQSSVHRVLCGTNKIRVFERLRSVRVFKLLRVRRLTQLCVSGHAANIERFPVSVRTFLVQPNKRVDAAWLESPAGTASVSCGLVEVDVRQS